MRFVLLILIFGIAHAGELVKPMKLVTTRSDVIAGQLCRDYRYMYRVRTSQGTPTALVWCIDSTKGIPSDVALVSVQ